MQDSPELLMMRCIEKGNAEEVMNLFPEHKQFSSALPVVDTPYGRFVGKEAIGEFAKGFVKRFKADGLTIIPIQEKYKDRIFNVLPKELQDIFKQNP